MIYTRSVTNNEIRTGDGGRQAEYIASAVRLNVFYTYRIHRTTWSDYYPLLTIRHQRPIKKLGVDIPVEIPLPLVRHLTWRRVIDVRPTTRLTPRSRVTDYDGGAGGYQVQNTYGPPRDYYYDERPDYYRPHQPAGDGHHHPHHLQSGPPEVIYHQYHHPSHQQHPYEAGGHNRPGELDIQPLLWPLAGITLLGVLSALVKAPLLLHLGTVHRRRRRRSTAREPGDTAITAETIKSLLDKVYKTYIIIITLRGHLAIEPELQEISNLDVPPTSATGKTIRLSHGRNEI